MRRYRKTYKCSETFPARVGEEWVVRDGRGNVVELWGVIHGSSERNPRFTVQITEYVPEDRS